MYSLRTINSDGSQDNVYLGNSYRIYRLDTPAFDRILERETGKQHTGLAGENQKVVAFVTANESIYNDDFPLWIMNDSDNFIVNSKGDTYERINRVYKTPPGLIADELVN